MRFFPQWRLRSVPVSPQLRLRSAKFRRRKKQEGGGEVAIWRLEKKDTSVRSSEPLPSVSYELNLKIICDCSFSCGIFLKCSHNTLDDDSIVFLLLSRKPPQLSCAARMRSIIAACSGVRPMSAVLDLFASAGTDLYVCSCWN